MANENGNRQEAIKYFMRSCDLKYGLGCWELYLIYKHENSIDEAQKFREKACSFDVRELCK